MAVQAIWNGTISFSLVAIPVRLVAALAPRGIPFHLLHRADHSRLSRRMFCPEEQTTVSADEIVRGYEIDPGRYVLMTDEELGSVSPERSRTIEIIDFVDLKEVDPVYFDHPYYLVPSRGGEKAYRLLVEVMRAKNRAGLAKFVLAEREYSAALLSRDGALALTTLHYSGEIVPAEDLSPEKERTEEGESVRMKESIARMMQDFDPGKYADSRRKRIRDLLAAKAKEHPLVEALAPQDEEEDGPPDLVAALEESMRKVRESR